MLYLFYYITLFMNKFYDANIWMFVIYSYLLIWKIYIDKNAWIYYIYYIILSNLLNNYKNLFLK